MEAIMGILVVFFLVLFAMTFVEMVVHGTERITPGMWWPKYKAYRIRAAYQRKLMDRALTIQAEHPDIQFQCNYYPGYPSLCRECCAVSRASKQMQQEQESINRVLKEAGF